MKKFEISRIACGRCGETIAVESFTNPCPKCGCDRFSVEINRSTWGVDLGNLVEPVALQIVFGDAGLYLAAAKEGAGAISPFYRTKSLLEVADVSGKELLDFLAADLKGRRAMYVTWKRREIQAHLKDGQKFCGRCGGVFVSYRNAWNTAGYCSRACFRVGAKSNS